MHVALKLPRGSMRAQTRDDSVQEFDSPFVFAPSSSPHSHAQIGVFHDAEASVETADVFEIIPSHEHGLVAE